MPPQEIVDALNAVQAAKDNRITAQGDLDVKNAAMVQAQGDAAMAQQTLNTAMAAQQQTLAELKAKLDATYGT